MQRKYERPEERRVDNSPLGETVLTHPAYGSVTVTNWHGFRDERLFGSDLVHGTGMRLTFTRAKVYRGLSQYRHFGTEILLQVDLSMAQWARLVASSGIGQGVPVTLREVRVGDLESMPAISPSEQSRKELHGQEMAEALKKRLAALTQLSADLAEAIEKSKGKTALREIAKEIARNAEQLPGSVRFVYDQFNEALETATEEARVEVESHVELMNRRIAFERSGVPHPPPRSEGQGQREVILAGSGELQQAPREPEGI